MVTDKLTRDAKRKLLLEDKAKRKSGLWPSKRLSREEAKAERLVIPYKKPRKVTITNYEDLQDQIEDLQENRRFNGIDD